MVGRIGEGAHGVVVRARHNNTGLLVALKKVPLRRLDQGMPTTALREIKALKEINSHHVSPFIHKRSETLEGINSHHVSPSHIKKQGK